MTQRESKQLLIWHFYELITVARRTHGGAHSSESVEQRLLIRAHMCIVLARIGSRLVLEVFCLQLRLLSRAVLCAQGLHTIELRQPLRGTVLARDGVHATRDGEHFVLLIDGVCHVRVGDGIGARRSVAERAGFGVPADDGGGRGGEAGGERLVVVAHIRLDDGMAAVLVYGGVLSDGAALAGAEGGAQDQGALILRLALGGAFRAGDLIHTTRTSGLLVLSSDALSHIGIRA